MLEHFYQRIRTKALHVQDPAVLVTSFGDSVTQGCMEYQVIDHQSVYHNILKSKLESAYPETSFSVHNAGVGGDTASGAVSRLTRDVLRHDPDLVIVGFCLNDALDGIASLERFSESMKSIVARIQDETLADIILLTPNFMAKRETDRVHPEHHAFSKSIISCQNEGVLNAYVTEIRDIGKCMNVLVADVYSHWEQMALAGVDTTALLSNGLNHPDASGQQLIADTIWQTITSHGKMSPSDYVFCTCETPAQPLRKQRIVVVSSRGVIVAPDSAPSRSEYFSATQTESQPKSRTHEAHSRINPSIPLHTLPPPSLIDLPSEEFRRPPQ